MEIAIEEIVTKDELVDKGFIPMGKVTESGASSFMVARDESSQTNHKIYVLTGINYSDGIPRYREFHGQLRKS